ncbi:MAG: DUF4845 domain-containing protein [Acidiferrobacterales bacterium]
MTMRRGDRQSGMSIWGLMVSAAVGIFFLLLFFKLLPPYINNAKIKTDLANMASQPGASRMTLSDIHNALSRRFEIDDVSYADLRTDLHVTRPNPNGPLVVQIAYQVRVPMAYNITALLDFNDTAQLGAK